MNRAASRACRATVLVAVLASVASPAVAHLKILRGQLIDLVQRSNAIVIGKVIADRSVGARSADLTVTIDHVLSGEIDTPTVTVRAASGFAPKTRYVLFLRRSGSGLENLAASGTVFASRPQDDAAYRHTIAALRRALGRAPAARIDALRAALLPALSASAPALRYHAALELRALTHNGHPLHPNERHTLERLVADAHTDPALRPLLSGLLQQPPP